MKTALAVVGSASAWSRMAVLSNGKQRKPELAGTSSANQRKALRLDQAELDRPKFVHQMEEAFARILDYYHIHWEYEPRTFDLEWDEDGNVLAAFTPDFYLPGQDLYIELTTLRPKLMRQKNAKLRRMQELYPDINIKLFRRQDLRDMMIKYGLDEEAEQLAGTEAQSTGLTLDHG